MNPVVHSFGRFCGRHHADVVMCTRRMDCEASLAISCVGLGFRSARHNTPFKQSSGSTEG
eukprot:570897-Pleurochrysis_carterae.AAC.1